MPESGEAQAPQQPKLEKQPNFIKDFSKKKFSEERNVTAAEIKAKRTEYFDRKKSLPGRKEDVAANIQEAEGNKDSRLEELGNIEATISSLSDSWVSRTLRSSNLRQLKKSLDDSNIGYRQILQDLHGLKKEEDTVTRQLEQKGINAELGEARGMLNKFYDRQKEAWSNSPYDMQELKAQLTPEHLASLPLADYITLLKRFPSYMITHVTRQGIRDHTGHSGHSSGKWEYEDGFMKILQNGKLESAMGMAFKDGMTKEAMAEFLTLDHYLSREAALYVTTDKYLDNTLAGGYTDRKAVHFATEWVADYYYGSETANEIFFAFPSAFMGANYYSKGALFHKSATNDGWNDTWIWNTKDAGIPIDSAVTFIPGGAQVDAQTGSRYQLDGDKKPVVNQARFDTMKQLMQRDDFIDALREVDGIYRKSYGWERDQALLTCKDNMKSKFGVEDDELMHAIVNTATSQAYVDKLIFAHRSERQDPALDPAWIKTFQETGGMDTAIESYMENAQVFYELAKNPVTSKDFWEDYFKKNPSLKPNKIVYYGGTPERALDRWRENVGLTNFPKLQHEDYTLGYPDFSNEKEVFRQAAIDAVDIVFPMQNIPQPISAR